MSIFDFLKSFTKTGIDRDSILEDLNTADKAILEVLLPALKNIKNSVSTNKIYFNTKEVQKVVTTFGRVSKNLKNKSLTGVLDNITDDLISVSKIIPIISSVISEEFPEKVSKDSLDVRQATILRSTEHIIFITRYTITLLDYILDSALIQKFMHSTKITKPAQNYIQSNLFVYIRLMNAYKLLTKDFLKQIRKVPAVVVDIKDKNLLDLDISGKYPVLSQTNTHGFIGSPFYRLGMMYAELKAAYYNWLKTRKHSMDLKIMYLESEEPSPAIEKQLKFYKEQSEKYEYKIAKMEENVKD